MNQPATAKKKTIFERIITNLTFWVLIAVIAGALLGNYFPAIAIKMEFIGKWFVNIIKLFIGPIIFLTIVLGICGMGSLKKAGKIGIKSLIYFEVLTTIALVIGIIVANIIEPGKIDKTSLSVQDASKYISKAGKGIDWAKFFMDNFTLQVLVVAIIAGIALNFYSGRQKIVNLLSWLSKIVFIGLKWVMYLAPLGAFGGMAFTVGKFGLQTLIPLGKLMLTVYTTMAIFIFLILGLILRYYRESIWQFLKYIKEEFKVAAVRPSSLPIWGTPWRWSIKSACC